jgi:hypothetical protein
VMGQLQDKKASYFQVRDGGTVTRMACRVAILCLPRWEMRWPKQSVHTIRDEVVKH